MTDHLAPASAAAAAAASRDVPPAALPDDLSLRVATDADADALIALVGGVYDEYPGCVLDLDDGDDDLLAPASTFAAKDGVLWVVTRDEDEDEDEDEAEVVACAGYAPAATTDNGTENESGIELKRLYVSPSARRCGLGAILTGVVESVAKQRGDDFVDLWSDTRFIDAHRLYDRLGYRRLPETRDLHDPSNTTEYHYRRDLTPCADVTSAGQN